MTHSLSCHRALAMRRRLILRRRIERAAAIAYHSMAAAGMVFLASIIGGWL